MIEFSISISVLGGNILAYSILLAIFKMSLANDEVNSFEESNSDLKSFISFFSFSNAAAYCEL